jgi:hypothetical protein
MMVPDFVLIAEIMMFSEGFGAAKALARKMAGIMELSQQQLSKQDHYDYGTGLGVWVAGVDLSADYEGGAWLAVWILQLAVWVLSDSIQPPSTHYDQNPPQASARLSSRSRAPPGC